uniref:Uncharacterized protein n=1 Tax=Alexandrium catenella TaxID=2925 RepID=A0A7S1PIY3_ALECA
MPRPGRALLALLAAAALPGASAARVTAAANPIRRVVTMLQMMHQKVTTEGEKEEKLFSKYMCYCDDSMGSLKKGIAQAETKVPELDSSIKESEAEVTRLKGDVAQGKTDLQEAKEALTQSKQIREKEHQDAVAEIDDNKNNLKALQKAIKALSRGGSEGFLQTSAAGTLRQLTVSLDMSTSDRDVISAFLSQGQLDGYQPQSSEVLGILKQMEEETGARIAEVTEKDAVAAEQSAAMVKAKAEQIDALKKQIDSKTARLGQLAVDIVNLQADYDDTSKSLEQDKKFLADLSSGCSKKKDGWAVRQRTRSQELQAISETIKVLNDDEALTLFKKSLPTPSFLQVKADPHQDLRQQALHALRKARSAGKGVHGSRLDLLTMALKAKKVSFFKVIKMLDDMVALLNKEQADDEKKRDYCRAELDQTEGQVRDVGMEISDLGKAREEAKQKIAALTEEVAALSDGIKKLDEQVAESTKQRKEEHSDYVEKLGMNTATKELLQTAKKILGKFYNSPSAESLAQEDDEETLPFFAQLSQQREEEAPAPPPDTWSGRYKKQDEGNSGVMEMISQLQEDMTQDSAQLETNEKQAQAQYEESMADAAKKRASDARVISEKEAVKAELEARLHKMNQESKSKTKESTSLKEYAKDLHNECDWLVANFAVRKEARAGEVESLRDAKAVLSGANYGSKSSA